LSHSIAPLADDALDDADKDVETLIRVARSLVRCPLALVNRPHGLAQVFNLVCLKHSGREQVGGAVGGAVNLDGQLADRGRELRLLLDDEVEAPLRLGVGRVDVLSQLLKHLVDVAQRLREHIGADVSHGRWWLLFVAHAFTSGFFRDDLRAGFASGFGFGPGF
jgi:hypothetical protein